MEATVSTMAGYPFQLPLPVSHTAGETHRDPVAEAELLAEPPEKNNSEAIILHN